MGLYNLWNEQSIEQKSSIPLDTDAITNLVKKKKTKIDSCLLYFRRKAQILFRNKSVLV